MPFRNVESHFSRLPQASVKRTKMKYNFTHKTTFNAGELVPFFVEEVLPGDTLQINTDSFVRLSPSIHPTMDNLYMDTYYFYVPNRLIWDDWTKFMGENDKAWAIDTSQFVPPFFEYELDEGICSPGSIVNHLGMPTIADRNNPGTLKATILDFNAYCKIWNDWFRDENLTDECPIFKGSGKLPTSYYTAYALFISELLDDGENHFDENNSCLPVAKYHDYFTSALPQPQKGADVLIPASGTVDLLKDGDGNVVKTGYLQKKDGSQLGSSNAVSDVQMRVDPYSDPRYNIGLLESGSNSNLVYNPNGSLGFENLQITINSLRLAFQTQRLLERDARGGTRYTELLQSHFGVSSPDARLQRSEYLGGQRISLNMSQVVQQSASTDTSPLGNLAGLSATGSKSGEFTKSFTEHGYVIGVCCVRPDRTYSQGLPKRYSRFNRLNYYFPVLANIGEQPILNKEIYASAWDSVDSNIVDKNDEVFGYQEAWAEYRYQNNRCSGLFAPGINGSLSSWTYQDNYTDYPKLSNPWLYQGRYEVNETLVFQNQPQFMADFYCHGSFTRPMPLYSIPGLIDHN